MHAQAHAQVHAHVPGQRTESNSSSKTILLKLKCPWGRRFKATLQWGGLVRCLAWGLERLAKPWAAGGDRASGARGL